MFLLVLVLLALLFIRFSWKIISWVLGIVIVLAIATLFIRMAFWLIVIVLGIGVLMSFRNG